MCSVGVSCIVDLAHTTLFHMPGRELVGRNNLYVVGSEGLVVESRKEGCSGDKGEVGVKKFGWGNSIVAPCS